MRTFVEHYLSTILMLFFMGIASAQQLELRVFTKDVLNQLVIKDLKYKLFLQNETLLNNEISAISDSLKYKGYLNVKLDSLIVKAPIYSAFFDLGSPIKTIDIIYNFKINSNILKKHTYIYNDSVFTLGFKSVKPLLNELISDFEQSGKPFTKLKLSEIDFNDSIAIAHLLISNDNKRTLNKIIIKDYENFPKSYLIYYLKLHSGDVFNSSKLSALSKKINYLNFVSEIKPPEVLFTDNETNLYLYLKKVQSNSIDGLIGFTSKQNGKGVLFNGYLDLQLENAFNSGESLSLLFKNNGLSQQKFNIDAKLPYVFNSKFTASGSLNIYKQDSLYINVSTNLALNYPVTFNSEIGLSIKQESSSNLLTTKILNIESYQSTYFGLTYQFFNFTEDDLFNEKVNFKSSFFLGNKTVESIKTSQFKIAAEASYLWLINQRNAIFIKNESAFLNTSNYLTNELFRVGGYKNLRGFDEESLLASSFSIFNFEYRYKTNFESYFYTITDIGYLNNAIIHQKLNFYSLGLGYKFRAKMGVINLGYALGFTNNHQVKLQDAKIHFSLKTIF